MANDDHKTELAATTTTAAAADRTTAPSTSPMNLAVLVVTELVRWAVAVAVVYLTVWQYCETVGYTVFVANSSIGVVGQFWGVFSAIMVGISLVFYLPLRLLSIKVRSKYNIMTDERW